MLNLHLVYILLELILQLVRVTMCVLTYMFKNYICFAYAFSVWLLKSLFFY